MDQREENPKKKKNGVRLLFLGLVAGFIASGAIVLFERYLASEISNLLEEEVKKACNCSFDIDSISVSLLTLSAKGKRARILQEGEAGLVVDTLRARFSIEQIAQRNLVIKHLELEGAQILGVGNDSMTFQFIDYLAAPISPEKQEENTLRLVLNRLSLSDATYSEEMGLLTLLGENASLTYQRLPDDNIKLTTYTPSVSLIDSLSTERPSLTVPLGALNGELLITDDTIDFQKLTLIGSHSHISAQGKAAPRPTYNLEGDLSYTLNTAGLHSSIKSGKYSGSASLGGTLANPSWKGTMELSAQDAMRISPEPEIDIDFTKGGGTYIFRYNDGDPFVTFTKLLLQGSQGKASLQEPLTINENGYQGIFSLQNIRLDTPQWGFSDGDVTLAVTGALNDPSLSLQGRVNQVYVSDYELPALSLKGIINNNELSFDANHRTSPLGALTSRGKLTLSEGRDTLDEFSFELSDFLLIPKEDNTAESKQLALFPRLSGKGNLHGELAADLLRGNATLVLSSEHFEGEAALRGTGKLEDGEVALSLTNESNSVNVSLALSLTEQKQSTLEVALNEFTPKEYDPSLECMQISLHSLYTFYAAEFATGDGTIDISNLSLGCKPHTTRLEKPAHLTIGTGKIPLPEISLIGKDTQALITGSVDLLEGYDLVLNGSLQLSALLPFVPMFDDLRGELQMSCSVTGPLGAPIFEGEAKLLDGEMGIESANINVTDVDGDFLFDAGDIKLLGVQGTINGGEFALTGEVYPFNMYDTFLDLDFSHVYFELFEDTSIELSGDLHLAESDPERLALGGTIEVDSARFEKNLDLVTLIREVPSLLFQTAQDTREERTKLPDLDLALNVSATRNIFILTTWLGAELRGALSIAGTLAEPNITGSLDTLSGWFGLNNRRFDVTSGEVFFEPITSTPTLEVLAETYARSRSGDNVLVLLEAEGPLLSPRIRLSSDRGYSQEQILSLLTSGGGVSGVEIREATNGNLTLETQTEQLSTWEVLESLITGIASIDSLSIEPRMNARRGQLEPTIVAQKNLLPHVNLIGESFFSTPGDDARLSLQYDLTQKVSIAGSVDTVSSENESALGIDLKYTILDKSPPFLTLTFSGNSALSEETLRRNQRLASNSRIPTTDLERIEGSILRFYAENGFFEASARALCKETSNNFCRELTIEIEEGPQAFVREIKLKGDALPDELDLSSLLTVDGQQPADQLYLEKISNEIIRALRLEGYIRSRVKGSYIPLPKEENTHLLSLSLYTGTPVTFTFTGNKTFSPEEFLETINLLKRKQPFGNNTIRILVENIERIYREAGYLYATIDYQELRDPVTERINYLVTINEDIKAPVSEVRLKGNAQLTASTLRSLIPTPELTSRLFDPTFAIDEEIKDNAVLLKELYVEEGFPFASVRGDILPSEKGRSVDIIYTITEGEPTNADWLTIEGYPSELTLPQEPQAPYSIPKANRYIDTLFVTLQDKGFLEPNIWSELSEDTKTLTVHIIPGERTVIQEISILGLSLLDRDIVEEKLNIEEGSFWDNDLIREGRRRLLRTGLVSRVDVQKEPLETHAVRLTVEIVERSLQTLEVGGGANSAFGLHLFGEATDKSLFLDGRSLALRFDTYYDDTQGDISRGLANLRYNDPSFLDSELSLSENLQFQKIDLATQEFDLERSSFSSLLYRNYIDGGHFAFGHTIFHENLSNVTPGATLSTLDTGGLNVSFLHGTVGLDQRDDPLNARKGYNLQLDTHVASEALGSDVNYVSIGGAASFIIPFGIEHYKFALANNTRSEAAWTYGGTPHIPISQRYYLGGRTTVRGFREHSLGPRGNGDAVIGGDFSLLNNFELRYFPGPTTSLHLFFDQGNVFLQDDEIDLDELRYSTGIGVRYLSPIGPIGFDIGHPLDEKSGEPSVRFHFQVGSTF